MTAHQSATDPNRKRLMIVLGAVAGLAVLVLVGGKVLGGGGSGGGSGSFGMGDLGAPTAAGIPATPAPATPARAAAPASPATEPVETFEVFTTKNPFQPLRTAAAATGPAPAASAPAPAALPAVATAPVIAVPTALTTGTATAPVASTSTATGGQVEPTRTTNRVALLDVFTEGGRTVANVRVNDTVAKVGAGDPFATNFKVVSLDAGERCGRFLFGDDQFRLCRGEEVLK